jgi:alpha-tubulin suppressor-like RCC1 family protein
MALTNKGDLYTFGNAKDGKLGYEDINPNVYIPRKINGVP